MWEEVTRIEAADRDAAMRNFARCLYDRVFERPRTWFWTDEAKGLFLFKHGVVAHKITEESGTFIIYWWTNT